MRPTLSLIRREFAAYFTGPAGYVAMFGFLVLTGLLFNLALSLLTEKGGRGVEYPVQVLLGGADSPPEVQYAGVLFWGLFPAVTGIITMRLLAESAVPGRSKRCSPRRSATGRSSPRSSSRASRSTSCCGFPHWSTSRCWPISRVEARVHAVRHAMLSGLD